MKKYSLYFSKKSKYFTIMLYFFDDFRKRNMLDQLLKIFDLFNGSQTCARVIRKLNDHTIFELRDIHIESIARSRSNEVLAIRFTQDKIGHFLNYIVHKDERTEVYFFDEVNWDIFINLYDVGYIKTQIDKIMK